MSKAWRECHYFCEVDGKFLCVVCCGSKDHKTHNTTLIEEVAQSYQVGIWGSFPVPPLDQEFSGDLENCYLSLWVCTHCPYLCTWVENLVVVKPSRSKSLRRRTDARCNQGIMENGKNTDFRSRRCRFRFRLLNFLWILFKESLYLWAPGASSLNGANKLYFLRVV